MSSREFAYIDSMPRRLTTRYSPAIRPAFSTRRVSAPIRLYQGDLQVMVRGEARTACGRLWWEWLPEPRVRICAEGDGLFAVEWDLEVRLPGFLEPLKGRVTRKNLHGYLEGTVSRWVRHDGSPLRRLVFHLANFPNFIGSDFTDRRRRTHVRGQLTFATDGWRVVIQRTLNPELIADIEQERGYGITHVGQLSRADGSPFTPEECEPVLEALGWYLSFARGGFTFPLLRVGYTGRKKVLLDYRPCRASAGWHKGWMPLHQATRIEHTFADFYRKFQDPDWNEALRVCINWLVDSGEASTVDAGLVMAQFAVEGLAAQRYFRSSSGIPAKQYDGLRAAEKLRLMLSQCSIPATLPAELTNLQDGVHNYGWKDGPQAVTELRNAVAHAKLHKLTRLSVAGRWEAAALTRWYVEMILLKVLGYAGPVHILWKHKAVGDAEDPPWLQPGPTLHPG